MKKLILLITIFLAACCTTRNIYNGNQTYEQLDSILKAEHVLTYDSMPFQDYETNKRFYIYFFKRDSLVIRWIYRGDSVQITKRINK